MLPSLTPLDCDLLRVVFAGMVQTLKKVLEYLV